MFAPALLMSSCDFEELNFKGIEKFELLDQKEDQIKLLEAQLAAQNKS